MMKKSVCKESVYVSEIDPADRVRQHEQGKECMYESVIISMYLNKQERNVGLPVEGYS